MAGGISNERIYELIERVRIELKEDIKGVESKVDGLADGRVKDLEKRVNAQDVTQATAATKLAVVGFIAASVIGAIISVVVPRLLK